MFVASRICKAFKSFGAFFSVHLFEFNKKEKISISSATNLAYMCVLSSVLFYFLFSQYE